MYLSGGAKLLQKDPNRALKLSEKNETWKRILTA